MSCTVFIVDQAEQHLRDIDNWPVTPEIGARHTRTTVPGVRRVLLRRSKHYVYYVYDRIHAIVYIIAVWSNARGSEPPLASW